MKLVREHINEKFTQDSDPVEDLGIGIPELIKDAPKNILFEDLKHEYLKNLEEHEYLKNLEELGNISIIHIEGARGNAKRFIIIFNSGRLKNEEGKQINRKQYAEYLVKISGISKVFSDVYIGYHDVHNIVFRIKPEYQKYFNIGRHYLDNGKYTTW